MVASLSIEKELNPWARSEALRSVRKKKQKQTTFTLSLKYHSNSMLEKHKLLSINI